MNNRSTRSLFRGVVASVLLAMGSMWSGCSSTSAPSGGTSNGPLLAIPPSVNFGAIPSGQWHDTTVTLFNSGTVPVTIIAESMSAPMAKDSGLSLPVTIAPQGEFVLHVQFNPSQTDAATAYDSIRYSSNGSTNSVVISLTATGGGPAVFLPNAGSTFTFTYKSVDTNGITSSPSDSTYTVVSNSLTYQGKTNVLEVRDEQGGLNYYHFESNGDVSVYVDLSSLPVPVSLSTNWFVLPIGSGIEHVDTLFDSTVDYPSNGSTLPVLVTVVTDAKSLGNANVSAAGQSFPSQKGSITVTFNASTSVFGGFFPVATSMQTTTIWYAKQLGYYPERTDQTVNSGIALGNTTASDSYLLQSYSIK